MRSGLTPLFTTEEIDRWIKKFNDRAEKNMVRLLKMGGEYAVKRARESGNYRDHTGNLRSSIGYLIAKDGTLIEQHFTPAGGGSDKKRGVEEARKLAMQVSLSYRRGYVLIVVAGMQYAAAVESRGRDVLSTTVYATDDFLRGIVQSGLNTA